jgi:hypothetical protein
MESELSSGVLNERLQLEDKTKRRSILEPLVCLNFKVPLRIRQRMKLHALRNNVTMTELLLRLLEEKLLVGDACLDDNLET